MSRGITRRSIENIGRPNIKIENEGQKLISSNYWESEYAKKETPYLSISDDCIRLLLPEGSKECIDTIKKVKACKGIILSKGRSKGLSGGEENINDGTKVIEVLFDGFNKSYTYNSLGCCFLGYESWESIPKDGTNYTFAIYTEGGEKGLAATCDCKVRTVINVPYLYKW